MLLEFVVIYKNVSYGAVRNCWGWWFSMAHLYELNEHLYASITVYKKGSQLCFHCPSKDVSHVLSFDMN